VSAVTVRRAVPTDASAVRQVLEDTYARTWRPQLSDLARGQFEAAGGMGPYVERYLEEFVVAQDASGRVLGLVHWRDDLLWALHVLGDRERAGIGTTLLKHAEAAMRDAGVVAARIESDTFNTLSRRFYAKHGYAEVAEYPDAEWGSGFTTVLLVKRLLP
jgi:GNAT superfamily N-acetyltransferase